jgi:hypothetical protein
MPKVDYFGVSRATLVYRTLSIRPSCLVIPGCMTDNRLHFKDDMCVSVSFVRAATTLPIGSVYEGRRGK